MRIVSSIVNPFSVLHVPYGSNEVAKELTRLADAGGGDIERLVNLACDGFKYKQKIRKSWVVSVQAKQVKSEISALCRIIRKWIQKI